MHTHHIACLVPAREKCLKQYLHNVLFKFYRFFIYLIFMYNNLIIDGYLMPRDYKVLLGVVVHKRNLLYCHYALEFPPVG